MTKGYRIRGSRLYCTSLCSDCEPILTLRGILRGTKHDTYDKTESDMETYHSATVLYLPKELRLTPESVTLTLTLLLEDPAYYTA